MISTLQSELLQCDSSSLHPEYSNAADLARMQHLHSAECNDTATLLSTSLAQFDQNRLTMVAQLLASLSTPGDLLTSDAVATLTSVLESVVAALSTSNLTPSNAVFQLLALTASNLMVSCSAVNTLLPVLQSLAIATSTPLVAGQSFNATDSSFTLVSSRTLVSAGTQLQLPDGTSVRSPRRLCRRTRNRWSIQETSTRLRQQICSRR